jgi:DivIVA domain-containing protein
VPLERQTIEKKDFPIGRRGYDPDAVDAHLAYLADQVDELKRTSRRRSETLASSASEQVRAIVEAAETSAAEIQRQAEDEARDIRAEASEEAQSTRQQATEQARDYVGKVSESTAVMLQRLDAMESELAALLESLRTGSNRLNADLQLLEGNLDEVREAAEPRGRFESEPEAAAAAPPAPAPVAPAPAPVAPAPPAPVSPPVTIVEEAYVDEIDEVVEAELDELQVEAEYDGGFTEAPAADDDTEGARLIALNMALNGTPREETEKYLSENFELRNRGQLLDEVYASVEG